MLTRKARSAYFRTRGGGVLGCQGHLDNAEGGRPPAFPYPILLAWCVFPVSRLLSAIGKIEIALLHQAENEDSLK